MRAPSRDELGDLVALLCKETPFDWGMLFRWRGVFEAAGWSPHQIRRGVHAIARSGDFLNVRSLIDGAEMTGDIDAFLDQLTQSDFGRVTE